MKKILYIYIFIVLGKVELANAQWTSADSIWLQKILSGKDTLRLNPEMEKAIIDGNLINSERTKTPLQPYSLDKMPIQTDFSEIIKPEGSVGMPVDGINLDSLPPAVFWLYTFRTLSNHVNDKKSFKFMGKIEPKQGLVFESDFNDVLSTTFSPHYRQLKNNKKNAVAYKTYDSLPTPEFSKKQKKYFDEHPEIVSPKVKAIFDQRKDSLALNDSVRNVF